MSRYIPKQVREAVKIRDRDRCRVCGSKSEYMEFDHITPYSKGAPASVANIQLLCRKCNLKKRDSTEKCPKCDGWLPHDARYCHSCGKTLSRGASTANSGWSFRNFSFANWVGLLILVILGVYLLIKEYASALLDYLPKQ